MQFIVAHACHDATSVVSSGQFAPLLAANSYNAQLEKYLPLQLMICDHHSGFDQPHDIYQYTSGTVLQQDRWYLLYGATVYCMSSDMSIVYCPSYDELRVLLLFRWQKISIDASVWDELGHPEVHADEVEFLFLYGLFKPLNEYDITNIMSQRIVIDWDLGPDDARFISRLPKTVEVHEGDLRFDGPITLVYRLPWEGIHRVDLADYRGIARLIIEAVRAESLVLSDSDGDWTIPPITVHLSQTGVLNMDNALRQSVIVERV